MEISSTYLASKMWVTYFRRLSQTSALSSRRVTENTKTYTPGKLRNMIDALTEGELLEYEKSNSREKINGVADVEDMEDVPVTDRIDYRVLSAIVNDVFGAGQDTLSSAFLFILHYMIR